VNLKENIRFDDIPEEYRNKELFEITVKNCG